MTSKTATQVLQEAIFSSVCEAIGAFKENAGGSPNVLARDLGAIHGNTSFDTLPEVVQKSIQKSVQDALNRLNKDGYAVAPKNPVRVQKTVTIKSDPAFRKRNR